jgi:hypothetical protein
VVAPEAAKDGAAVGVGETVVATSTCGSGAGSFGWARGVLAWLRFGWAGLGLFGVAMGSSALGSWTVGFSGLGLSALGSSALGSSTLGSSALGSSALGSSTLGSSTLGSSTLGSSTLGFSGVGFSGLGFSASGGALVVAGTTGVCATAVPAPIRATANTKARSPTMLLALMRSHPRSTSRPSVRVTGAYLVPRPRCRAYAPHLRTCRTHPRHNGSTLQCSAAWRRQRPAPQGTDECPRARPGLPTIRSWPPHPTQACPSKPRSS